VQPDWSNQIITIYLIGQFKPVKWYDIISLSEMISSISLHGYHFYLWLYHTDIHIICDKNYYYPSSFNKQPIKKAFIFELSLKHNVLVMKWRAKWRRVWSLHKLNVVAWGDVEACLFITLLKLSWLKMWKQCFKIKHRFSSNSWQIDLTSATLSVHWIKG